jgi:hypothetical protein
MYTLGMDTIAGAKMLQLKFGRAGAFQPGQAVMHEERRARFITVSDGLALIRYWDKTDSVTVGLETLSLPPTNSLDPIPRARARGSAHPVRRLAWAGFGSLPRHHPRRRQLLRP